MDGSATIVWFRQDLRLEDQPALAAASRRGGPVLPVYIWQPDEEGAWPPGGASRWWLHRSLMALGQELQQRGSRLILLRGDPISQGGTAATLERLVEETGASAVFWNRRYGPDAISRDTRIKLLLRQRGIAAESFNGSLLYEPMEVANRQGAPFKVFAPFWKYVLARDEVQSPVAAPERLIAPGSWPEGVALEEFGLEPRIDWASGFISRWTPGERGAKERLQEFLGQGIAQYRGDRDRPGLEGTSRLSPHLHFGEMGPRQVWREVREAIENHRGGGFAEQGEFYLRELGWREFAYHLLFHFAHTIRRPLREEFERFPWRTSTEHLRAWQRGRTGYPIVDAAMRELWTTGWMHNRARMIAASFLVKDLLLPWQEGAAWFWDTLVDADLANNTLGWQWTAGCGADAAPYFRIFNPMIQGEKFDGDGAYVRRWVPEIAGLSNEWLHRPWEAPEAMRRSLGIELGTTYPHPIVNHNQARQEALAALAAIRSDADERN